MIYCLHKRGFTLPELLISISVIMIIFAFSGINLLSIIPNSDLTQIGGSFTADAKSQQVSAMLGESAGGVQVAYSVKINPTSYTLFKSLVYSPSDPSNYTVGYPGEVVAETTFPDSIISFSPVTGEIVGFQPESNQVAFVGPYGKSYTLLFNKLGNVYYINRM